MPAASDSPKNRLEDWRSILQPRALPVFARGARQRTRLWSWGEKNCSDWSPKPGRTGQGYSSCLGWIRTIPADWAASDGLLERGFLFGDHRKERRKETRPAHAK